MILLLLQVIIILSSGCVSSRQKHAESMDLWKGQHMNSLIRSQWGYPDQTTLAPNGNKLLVYYKTKTVVKQHYKYDKTRPKKSRHMTIPYTDTEECKTFFEINPAGKIVNVNWRGAACR